VKTIYELKAYHRQQTNKEKDKQAAAKIDLPDKRKIDKIQ
jgi:hypothetical protein